ncbi:MFS transporter [Ancylobacter oerskovii]|uniref:MFS transporter n=1 Tax=Ancylobacter oerskovii TaxID=459519 RepID=A0ABW4Z038_9HYPH|nr:MFS transporter [Ancylobacter oerskovii]MBS7542827.1 MFS transporter [Ancylobacter oerskovii]
MDMSSSERSTSPPVQAISSAGSRRWIVAAVLFLSVLAGFFDRISIAVLFTNTDFQAAMGTGFDPTRLGLLMTAFVIAYGFSNVFLSTLVDLFGPSRMLYLSIVLWGVFMALMGGVGSFTAMIVLRALLGVAEGPQFSIANSLVARWFPPHLRARGNSIWTIGSPLGSAIGFPLTTWLVISYGWRESFFVLAAFNILAILPLALLFVRDNAKGMEAAPVPVVSGPQPSYRESVRLFASDWRFWLIVVSSCGTLIYLWGLNSWLPSYLIHQRHIAPDKAGLYAALPFLSVFLGQIGGSYLSDRLGKRALVAGLGLAMAGVFMYFVSFMPSPQTTALMLSLSGLCWGTVTPVSYALILDVVPRGALATAVGLKNGLSNLAGALAPLVMGVIVSRTGSFDAAFLVLVGSSIIGGLLMLPLMRKY